MLMLWQAWGAATEFDNKRMIPFALVDESSVEGVKQIEMVESAKELNTSDDWRSEIINYLKNSILLDDRGTTKKVKARVARCMMISTVLYRRSFHGPY